jgi:hypothetical protein
MPILSRSLDRNAELQLNLSKQDYAPGRAGRNRHPRAVCRQWPDHHRARQGLRARVVPCRHHQLGAAHHRARGFRGQRLHQRAVHPRSVVGRDLHESAELRRGAVLGQPRCAAQRSRWIRRAGQARRDVTFKLHSTQPTKAVVFAVDEGILQVARYKLGDPLKFFFRKRMLEVHLADPRSDPAGLREADGDGGAGWRCRRRDRSPAQPVQAQARQAGGYWSGIVDVDGERISATPCRITSTASCGDGGAVSPDRIGTFEGSTTVRGDFVLSPNVPTTLAPGDEAESQRRRGQQPDRPQRQAGAGGRDAEDRPATAGRRRPRRA